MHKACIPTSMVKIIVQKTHESLGHFGPNKVFHYIEQYFHWPGMRRDIHKIIASCDLCQKTKYPNSNLSGLMQSHLPQKTGEILSVDLYGPLPRGKFGICLSTKKSTTIAILRKILNDYIPIFGKPNSVLTDCGSQFKSKRWRDAMSQEQIKIKYTSPYHPAIWFNITTHESTGFTPFQLQFGRKPSDEIKKLIKWPTVEAESDNIDEVIVKARQRMRKRAVARQARANKTNKIHSFQIGDLVLVRSHRLSSAINKEISKFFFIFEGPFKIEKILGPNAYLISDPKTGVVKGSQNVQNLRPYNNTN
ncbi:hypothetical protein B566_EDAN018280 [Ephemera danica]|nr:hypothetical protein B566_EDAN018280 [Ephemera danica]